MALFTSCCVRPRHYVGILGLDNERSREFLARLTERYTKKDLRIKQFEAVKISLRGSSFSMAYLDGAGATLKLTNNHVGPMEGLIVLHYPDKDDPEQLNKMIELSVFGGVIRRRKFCVILVTYYRNEKPGESKIPALSNKSGVNVLPIAVRVDDSSEEAKEISGGIDWMVSILEG